MRTIVSHALGLLGLLALTTSTAVLSDAYAAVFNDVPDGHYARPQVEAMYFNQITTGCAANPPYAPPVYCPQLNVSRSQMATFVGRAIHGPGWVPPPRTSVFPDVAANHILKDWVMQSWLDGVMGDCPSAPGHFCPDSPPVTREEMARILLRAKYGNTYSPPPAGQQIFADVPASSVWAPWIHQVFREEITLGCVAGPPAYFCPSSPVTREAMAIFISRTFQLLVPSRSLLSNSRFELPYAGSGANGYWRNLNGTVGTTLNGWTFINSAGVTGNYTDYSSGNPVSPESRQVALLEDIGEIRQYVTFPSSGWYSVDFTAAQRGHTASVPHTFRITVDGNVIDHKAATRGYVSAFNTIWVAAGNKEVTFRGLPGAGGTSFVDNVQLWPRAWGFADPGLVSGRVKSGYRSMTKGTIGDPLERIGCLWTTEPDQVNTGTDCNGGPTVFPKAFPFMLNTTWSSPEPYWVWGLNQEPADICNNVPNLSMPRRLPGQGLAGFNIINDPNAGEYFNRAHLVLNSQIYDTDQTCYQGDGSRIGIPFMSFGAQADRGNGKPIAAIHPIGAPSTVSFTAKLWTVDGAPNYFMLILLASWPDGMGRDMPRQIQLYLYSTPGFEHGYLKNRKWNWPIVDDTWPAGGTEIAYIDAASATATCNSNIPALTTAGQELTYTINVDALFRCIASTGGFSNPVPELSLRSNIPVYGVHWAVENLTYAVAGRPSTGPGVIWVSVHNMFTN